MEKKDAWKSFVFKKEIVKLVQSFNELRVFSSGIFNTYLLSKKLLLNVYSSLDIQLYTYRFAPFYKVIGYYSSTPQLQDLSQKWQRYISDCKLQLGRNKVC